jgi:subtilase family serine protease
LRNNPLPFTGLLSATQTAACLALLFLPAAAIRAAERQTLQGYKPAAVRKLNLQSNGRLPAATNLDLVIGLPLRNGGAFTNLLAQLYNPASPRYHRWLTPEQIAQRFGPTGQDYQAVIAFVKASGLTVTATHADHTLVRVNGTVADIEKMLHVKMLTYQHPTEPRAFYAPDVEPSVKLDVPLLYITGLNNFIVAHPGARVGRTPADDSPGDGSGSAPGNAYWGYDFRNAYVPGVSLNGAGQAVGLFEEDGYYTSDIAAYESDTGLPNVPVTNVPVDMFNQTPDDRTNAVLEVTLDIDMAIAMAPGLSRVYVYEGSNDNWLDILKRMQEDNLAKQLSSSWFFSSDPSGNTVYNLMAMQGQSFFQCSGDTLAFFDGVRQWKDDPNTTLCGGTMLTTVNGAWSSETTWNNGDGLNGSGGGISASYLGNYPIPTWQQGVSMSLNGGSTTMRNVPDVSMIAHHVFVYYLNGQHSGGIWGTSISAPLWAGFTALVNQQALAYGQPTTVGFLNPVLYAIGLGSNYTSCFHDITTGNNTDTGSPNLFYAVPGYDLCTGWGTPTGSNLINALVVLAGPVYVDFNYTGSIKNGSYNYPFKTLAQGTNAVIAGGTIIIKTAGSSAETMTVAKPMTITAIGGAATIGH